ncbi:CNGA3 [Lepeophtheirus salmonis]|uniref:CNGA3 n=1 Tax=Lepeophtheirus salmonis TaxID=72036 RepID=A0A7R8CKF2_LEPSM|nr:CNGA3 [Lepeophtheirus salmonis]CAF2848890.1 CNGA3 [Lepeophtheirus salmonis]
MWDVLKDYPAARVRLEAIAVKRLEKYKKAPLEKVSEGRSKRGSWTQFLKSLSLGRTEPPSSNCFASSLIQPRVLGSSSIEAMKSKEERLKAEMRYQVDVLVTSNVSTTGNELNEALDLLADWNKPFHKLNPLKVWLNEKHANICPQEFWQPERFGRMLCREESLRRDLARNRSGERWEIFRGGFWVCREETGESRVFLFDWPISQNVRVTVNFGVKVSPSGEGKVVEVIYNLQELKPRLNSLLL